MKNKAALKAAFVFVRMFDRNKMPEVNPNLFGFGFFGLGS